MRERMASLDGLRALAILLVVASHCPLSSGFPLLSEETTRRLFNGRLGVQIFFVLSGYLITWLLLREERETGIDLKNFYIRRSIRILPVYFAFLAVYLALDRFTELQTTVLQYVASLTFTKNFGNAIWTDGHLWSLSVEEQFYLLWPIAMVRLRSCGRWAVIAGVMLLCPIARVYSYVGRDNVLPLVWLSNGLSSFDALMIGCAAAILLYHYPEKTAKVINYMPAPMRFIAWMGIIGIWQLQAGFTFARFTVVFGGTLQLLCIAYLVVSYANVRAGWVFWLLNQPAVVYVGRLSYSLYIWQQLFLVLEGTYADQHPWWLHFPWNVGAAFLTAMLSYHVYEFPILALRRRFAAKTQETSPRQS